MHTLELKYNHFTAYVHHNYDWTGDAEVVVVDRQGVATTHTFPASILLAVGKAAYADELKNKLIEFAEKL